MASFVADASVTLCWFFEDEVTDWADRLLDCLEASDSLVVPAHWAVEVTNAMLMGVRRKRVPADWPEIFWDKLSTFSIDVDSPMEAMRAKAVIQISQKHSLTAYDAIYLELAMRRQLPLATLDAKLIRACNIEGVIRP